MFDNHLKNEIVKLIEETSKLVGKLMKEGIDFHIIHQDKNHTPAKLESGYMAVYTFYYDGIFLKIGQAGLKCNPRYQNQHYLVNGNGSTLAKQISLDSSMMMNIGEIDNISNWIKSNCERYDVIIDGKKHSKVTMNFIEGLLHYKYNPRYENRCKKIKIDVS